MITLSDINRAIDNLIDFCIFNCFKIEFEDHRLIKECFEDRYDYKCLLEEYIEKTFDVKIDLFNWTAEDENYENLDLYNSITIEGYKKLVKQRYQETKSRVN